MFCWCCNGTFSRTNGAWHKWLCPRLNYSIPTMILLTLAAMLLYPIIAVGFSLMLAIYASCLSTREGQGLSYLLRFSIINNKKYIQRELNVSSKEAYLYAILIGIFLVIPLSLMAATILSLLLIVIGTIPAELICLQYLSRLNYNSIRQCCTRF